jgi:hypothetical protein
MKGGGKPRYARSGLGLLGLGVLSLGLKTLLKGHLFYQTYWGGAAFAPIGVLIGVLIIYLATFGWSRFERADIDTGEKRHKSHKVH